MRYMTFILPLLMKAPRKNTMQVLSGFAAMAALVVLGTICVLIGIWFVLATRIGVDVAWLGVGAIMLLGAIIIFLGLRQPVKEPERVPYDIKTDPLGELIPEDIAKDPIIANIMQQIDAHPMGSMAAAVAIGALVGQELFKDDKIVLARA